MSTPSLRWAGGRTSAVMSCFDFDRLGVLFVGKAGGSESLSGSCDVEAFREVLELVLRGFLDCLAVASG